MNPDDVIRNLTQSISSPSEEVSEFLSNLTTEEGSPFLLMDLLLEKPEISLQTAELTYLYKSIKAQYKFLAEEICNQINERILHLVSELTFFPSNYRLVVDTIAYVYNHIPEHWPALFELINDKISNPEFHIFGLELLCGVLPDTKSEKAEEICDYLMETSIQAMSEESAGSHVLGVQLFSHICKLLYQTVDIPAIGQQHFEKLVQIISAPESYSVQQLSAMWSAINDLFSLDFLPDEIISSIVEQGIAYASNEGIDYGLRELIVSTIEIVVEKCPQFIENILNLSMSVIEASIVQDEAIDESKYTMFEKVFISFPHESVNPIVQQIISESIQSESVAQQAAALCVFRVLITNAPDCAHKDIGTIVDFLNTAITSEEAPILQEAACKVLQYFSDSFKSLNCHSPQFINPLLQLLTSDNDSLRTPAFAAAIDIISNLDTPIADLFTTVIALLPEIHEEDMTDFIDLLSASVPQTEEFDDDMCDAAIELIGQVVESGDQDSIKKLYDLGLNVLRQDDAQLETINELLLGSIGEFLAMLPQIDAQLTEDQVLEAKSLIPAIDYINGLASILKADADEIIGDFVEPIANCISQKPSDSNYSLFRACMRCCARIAKFSETKREALLPMITNAIQIAFDIEKPSTQKTAIECVLRNRNFLPDDLRLAFYKHITNEIIEKQVDTYLLISDAFNGAGKLLLMAGAQMEEYMSIANTIVEQIVNTTIPFLQEKPLIENGAKSLIFPSFCTFCAQLIDCASPCTNDICTFLLQWFEVDDELDHLEVSKPLLSVVKSQVVSQEVMQQVFDKITGDIAEANDPNYQQNIAFFLNLLVQHHTAMIPEIVTAIPSIEEWYQKAQSEKFGYQDLLANIGSLYLSIAARADGFDQQKIIEGIEQFPPYDVSETATMVNNLLILNQKGALQGQLSEAAALGIARFIVWDDDNVEKSEVPEEQSASLIQIFKTIVSQNHSILGTLERLYSKMRPKFRKISAVLN